MSNNRTVKKPAPPGSSKSSSTGSGKATHKGYVAPTPPKRAVSPLVLVIVGVIVVAVVAAIAVALTSGGGDQARTEPGVEQTRPVTVEGDALPPYETGPSDEAVGQQGATMDGATFDGTTVLINPGGGEKYTMLVFAAHWCPHCQKEIPVIADWMASGQQPANLDVYAVSTGVRNDLMNSANNWPPSTWFDAVGWPAGTVLADSGPAQADAGDEVNAAGTAYGVTGYPMVIMVGPDGSVIERHSGEFGVDSNPETFEAWVARTMSTTG
jgi:thiol-disulfide isomerase/thioredoxin